MENGRICLVILVAALFYSLIRPGSQDRRLEPHQRPSCRRSARTTEHRHSAPSKPSVFVWNPLATGLPVVFGRHGRYYVALSGSFIAHLFRDKDSFRAIMLHELGLYP